MEAFGRMLLYLATFLAGAAGKMLYDLLTDETKEQRRRRREAARRLIEGTWELQHGVWHFHSIHANLPLVAELRELSDAEGQGLARISAGVDAIARDHDLPPALRSLCRERHKELNLALMNLKAFSVTRQTDESERVSERTEAICKEIREAAERHLDPLWTKMFRRSRG
jgi:hypothetical protein